MEPGWGSGLVRLEERPVGVFGGHSGLGTGQSPDWAEAEVRAGSGWGQGPVLSRVRWRSGWGLDRVGDLGDEL